MRAPISKIRRERGSGVFHTLREMAISYQFKPGEKVSEIELAQRLGVSRTPVREALTRLVTDGFLLPASRGLVRRPLERFDPDCVGTEMAQRGSAPCPNEAPRHNCPKPTKSLA